MKSYELFRNEDDPASLVILCKFGDQDTAGKFVQSEELRKAHQESGAIGEPLPHFLEEVERADVGSSM